MFRRKLNLNSLFVFVLSSCVILPGCIGVSLIYPKGIYKDYRSQPIVLTSDDCKFLKYRGFESSVEIMKNHYGLFKETEHMEVIESGVKKYSVRSKIAWLGIVFNVLIPIPLVIPIGMDHYTFILRGDELLEEDSFRTQAYFYGLGTKVAGHVIQLPYCDFGTWPIGRYDIDSLEESIQRNKKRNNAGK